MSNNPSNKNHSFIGRFGILFLLMILITALTVSCGDDSASTAPVTSGGSQSGTILVIGNLSLEAVSADSVNVAWDPLSSNQGIQDPGVVYQVWVSNNNVLVTNYTVATSVLTVRYTKEVRGLISDKPYQITVKAVSGNTTRSEGSLQVVPSGVEFSASNTVDKLAKITDIANTTDTEMTVTWDEVSQAAVYAVIAAEEQANLAGALNKVTYDKKTQIVCKLKLTDTDCPVLETNADGRPFTTLTGMIPGSQYTTMVLPFSFRDLIGLKLSDGEGNKIDFVQAVKNLIEESGSPAGKQAREVGDAIVNSDAGVTNKAKVFSIFGREIGDLVNLSAKSYSNRVHVSWEHAAGANRYEAVLTTNSGKATNTVDRKYAAQLFGGRSVFSNVGVGSYTVSVLPYFENSSGVKVREGKAVQISGERKAGDPVFTPPNQVIGLKFTNHAPGAMTLSWSTKETAALSKYYIYYYQGTTKPDLPNYQANKGETNNLVIENMKPGFYTIRVDAVADGVVIRGGAIARDIYTTPEPPRLVTPWPTVITNIGGKLYHAVYGYTVLEGNPGGPTNQNERTAITASYRVESGEWKDTALISGRAVFGADEADVVSSYGKGYEVKVTVKNPGGFESSTTKSFVFRSFPEPIMGSKVTITPDDRRLLVTWPESENTHSSKAAFYTVVVTDGDVLDLSASVYGMTNVIGRSVVLDNLTNGKLYTVNVFPVSAEGWSLLSALGQKYNYPNIAASDTTAVTGIFGSYVGFPAQARPIGKPELVIGLTVKATNRSATDGAVEITWEASTNGSPADNYVVEYLKDVKPVLVIGNNNTVAVTGLDWSQALSMTVNANSNPSNRSYAAGITGLNTTGATNVFRVKAVNGKGNRGYEHYVLGTDATTPPSQVKDIVFSYHLTNGFTVSWHVPENGGSDRDYKDKPVSGYRVSWKEAGASAYEATNLAETVLTYAVTGLKPGTEYEVLVQAKNDANNEANYNAGVPMNVWTPSVPGGVTSIAYSGWWADRDSTAGFTVNWDAPTDFGKKNDGSGDNYTASDLTYTVRVFEAGSIVKKTYAVTGKSQTVTGLSVGRPYSVTVTASNAAGTGITVSGATNVSPSVPGAVTGLTASDYKTDGFHLSWTAPVDTGTNNDGSGKIATLTGYRVAYRAGNSGDFTTNFVSSGTSYTLTGLKSGTGYVVQVIAMNAAGEGKLHSIKQIWTRSTPAAPGPITLVSADETSIVLSWLTNSTGNDENGTVLELSNYVLQYSVDNNNWMNLTATGSGVKLTAALTNNTNATVVSLTRGATYHFRVAGSNAVGMGNFSSVLTIDYVLVTRIDFTSSSLNLKAGDNTVVSAALSPDNAINTYLITNLTWTSSDTNVATVSNRGNGSATFTAMGGGTAQVWAAAGNVSNFVTVTVLVSPANFRQTSAKQTAIDLVWDASPGTGITYKLSQIKDDGTANSPVELNGSPHTVSGLTANTYYRYQLKACAGGDCSDPASLLAVTAPTTSAGNDLNAVITAKAIPANLSGYDQMAQDIFSNYTAGKTVIPRYVVEGGTGNKTGTAWSNAAGSLKSVLDGITDAAADKVYAVLLGPGVYKAGAEMAMTNYVTIAGGISPLNTVPANAAAIGPTVLSGNKGHRVFNNNGITNTARLYGVTIADGKVVNDYGGGMYNENSSPILTGVVFSGNTASYGGGMFNNSSSPTLSRVVFSGNTANFSGGGMVNKSSSPILTGVVFSGNTADSFGGGMYNENSSPILTGVVFSGNTATLGGGMYNYSSTPTAVNTIFWGQSVGGDNVDFYYSVVEGGTSDSTNNIVTTDPKLDPLADNGGGIDTMAIPSDSPAKDKGIYVKRSAASTGTDSDGNPTYTFYYSIDKNDWYTTPKLDNAGDTKVTLPTDAIDLTATDMRGKPVQDRPDIGVYEVQPSP